MSTSSADVPPVIDSHQGDPALELGRAFHGAIAAVRRLRSRETRRPQELSDAQYRLLFGLCEHPELSSGELAHEADLSAAAATEMLDGLAAAGLVRRTRSELDRRVVLISLTQRGAALLDERRARYEPRWRGALSRFSDEELAAAAAVLAAVGELFDELAREA